MVLNGQQELDQFEPVKFRLEWNAGCDLVIGTVAMHVD
jgi:hypothetical protein